MEDLRLRIIGGTWRGRKVAVPAYSGLRPSLDSIRETAFNWLMHDIRGSHCLDCFAGTGIWSWESLSRGAASVTLIESNKRLARDLQQVARDLSVVEQVKIIEACLPVKRLVCDHAFDIVYLDPPFHQGLVESAFECLHAQGCLKEGALIYVETEKSANAPCLDHTVQLKHKSTRSIDYYLFCYQSPMQVE